MAGKTDLNELLAEMNPVLHEGSYVFVNVPDGVTVNFSEVISSFKEAEGLTVVLPRKKADLLNLTYDFVASWITLEVHSSLEAVGLTAAFSNALAKNGMSCNVIAGYYHDHIFVGEEDADRAMKILKSLSLTSKMNL